MAIGEPCIDRGRLLEELEPYVTTGMVEWRRDGESRLRELADWAAGRDHDETLVALLGATRLESDCANGERAAGGADLLFVHRPADWDDPLALVQAAARRLAPHGTLILFLPGGEDDPAGPVRIEAALHDADRMRLRALRRLDRGVILVAKKTGEVPRFALLPDSPGACLQIRALGPLEALESRGAIDLCVLPGDADESCLVDRDLLILQRFGGLQAVQLMLAAKRLGLPVAVEVDDDLFNLPWFNPAAKHYQKFEIRLMLESLIRGADAVVVSTPYLRQRMQQHNPNVLCMHNIVDTGLLTRRESPFREEGVTTIGYIGTRTHEEDIRPLIEPLGRLLREYDGRLRAVFFGHVPDELKRSPHIRYAGMLRTYQNFALALARSGIDIGIAPLMDVEFNRSKSAIKYLDYGACGIPGIFSDVVAYNRFVRDGENGLLVARHASDDWERAMRRMIDDPALRRRLADSAHRDVVAHHSIRSRAGDFLELYRGIADAGARVGTSPAGRSVESAAREEVRWSAIFRLHQSPKQSLPRLAALCHDLPKDTQVIVVSRHAPFSELLRLSGVSDVVCPTGDGDDHERNLMARALELARGQWVLCVDGRCRIPNGLLDQLSRHVAAEVGAIAPRGGAPSSEQSVHAIVGSELRIGASVQEILNGYAETNPVTEALWVEPDCVLLNRAAIDEAGGLDRRTLWEDTLVDLCRRLRDGGRRVLVANGSFVEAGDERGVSVPPAWRLESRERLAQLLSGSCDVSDPSRLRDPSRIYGSAGERLQVWVRARRDSTYLKGCLERIRRCGELPFELHVLHHADDEGARRAARAADARSHSFSGEDAGSLLEAVIRQEGVSHAALLHDGVMVSSRWLREMLIVMLRGDRPIVAPYSNDGSPEQRIVIDRGLSLEQVDSQMGQRTSSRAEQQCGIDSCAGFCVLLDLERIRETVDGSRPDGMRLLTAARDSPGISLATRAYVHVLGHPPSAPRLGMGAWPGGPFDLAFPTVEEIGDLSPESLHDMSVFVGRMKPLLAALKVNPGDARILAAIGVLYLKKNDLDNAMSFLERAKRMDPFSTAVRRADAHARRTLDRAFC